MLDVSYQSSLIITFIWWWMVSELMHLLPRKSEKNILIRGVPHVVVMPTERHGPEKVREI